MAPGEDGVPEVPVLLAAAVAGIGGAERPGQVAMAEAVEKSLRSGGHLAVQAGTGTGKSLAYLVPALAHAMTTDTAVVVATATIALQRQLVDRDLPRLSEALAPLLDREPVFAILKGRRNYLCLNRLRSGAPEEPADMLFDPGAVSAVGKQVQRLAQWAETTSTGDRDDVVPGVDDRAWRQVSVPATECIGAQRCPYGSGCFAERAREAAGKADIVVTNHALLAIDALEDYPVLPEHDVVIIDEAHDLVNRVTTQAAGELSAAAPETAARRSARLASADAVARLRTAGEALAALLPGVREGRIDVLDDVLATALVALRDAAAGCAAEVRATAKENGARVNGAQPGGEGTDQLAAVRAALAMLDDLDRTSDRIVAAFVPAIPDRREVVWLDRPSGPDQRRPVTLQVAPLEVGGLLAERLFRRRRVVLTSATLVLGGSFQPLARQWGLPAIPVAGDPAGRRTRPAGTRPAETRPAAGTRPAETRPETGKGAPRGQACRTILGLRTGLEASRGRLALSARWAWPGPGWTSARRSTIRGTASCTWPGTCRRPGGTGCPAPTSPSCAS